MDREGLALCSHEEADSGMMAHIADAANTYNSILTDTMDNNIVVLACMRLENWPHHYIYCNYVAFDTGNHYRLMG